MKAIFTLAATLLWIAVAHPGGAEENLHPFHGQGQVAPASDGSNKKELGIILEGEIAQKVYAAMTAREEKDECTGGFQKRDGGGLVCAVSVKRDEYQCSFGIVLGTGKVTFGPLTC